MLWLLCYCSLWRRSMVPWRWLVGSWNVTWWSWNLAPLSSARNLTQANIAVTLATHHPDHPCTRLLLPCPFSHSPSTASSLVATGHTHLWPYLHIVVIARYLQVKMITLLPHPSSHGLSWWPHPWQRIMVPLPRPFSHNPNWPHLPHHTETTLKAKKIGIYILCPQVCPIFCERVYTLEKFIFVIVSLYPWLAPPLPPHLTGIHPYYAINRLRTHSSDIMLLF